MVTWNNVNYSDGDIMRMQQDAVRRVQEMQQRARETVSTGGATSAAGAQAATGRRQTGFSPYPPPFGSSRAAQAASHGAAAPAPAPAQPAVQPAAQIQPQTPPPPPGPAHRHPAPPSSTKSGGLLSSLSQLTGGLGGNLSTTITDAISSVSSPLNKLLETLGLDGERLIILMLMLVIFNERGDKTLLLALAYLLF